MSKFLFGFGLGVLAGAIWVAWSEEEEWQSDVGWTHTLSERVNEGYC